MGVQFAVLASGSRGNSALFCDRRAGLLIDVGLGPKTLAERLKSVGASWAQIAAVTLTHTHSDHVDTATFSELARRKVVFYCHEGHRAELASDPGFQQLEAASLIRVFDENPFLTATGLRVEPIPVSHDGGPTFGFRIEAPVQRRQPPISLGYLADTGTWTESMADILTDVDVLGVEFNHDVLMQMSSGRPRVLIERNLGDKGHLSNQQGARLVEAVLSRSRMGAVRHLVLLHLSEQCNHPDLAHQAAQQAVEIARGRVDVHTARQGPAHPNLWIEPPSKKHAETTRPEAPAARIRRARSARAREAAPVLAGFPREDTGPDANTERSS
jgi:phosphoribosyl 1,2-cyclic phosphodiesterase